MARARTPFVGIYLCGAHKTAVSRLSPRSHLVIVPCRWPCGRFRKPDRLLDISKTPCYHGTVRGRFHYASGYDIAIFGGVLLSRSGMIALCSTDGSQ